jgi:hypothetical protein
MRSIVTFIILSLLTVPGLAAGIDTVHMQPNNIDVKSLRKGEYNYIIYFRKSKEGPASRMTLIKMNVDEQTYHGKSAIVVRQQWERDTVIHSAYSVFSPKDFSSILHDTWWKSLGYSMKFDFESKKADYKNVSLKDGIPDSVIRKGTEGFNQSFEKYNLNWHDDLLIYTMLPYKDNRTFVINYYDPGFGKAEEVLYSVTGSQILTGSNGEKIDCWVLNHDDKDSYERYWISKKTREVLKEEDFGKNGGYRFKIKLGVSGD